jgi:hypothetical protein
VDKQTEEEIPGHRLIQSFAIFMAAVALVSSAMMTYKGGRVYLGIESDPFGRDLIVGTWIGIPTALAGAICAYIALYGRGWDFFRVASIILIASNLLVPLSWIVMTITKTA